LNGDVITSWPLGGGNTLDQAYDQGGPGAGRTITADAGPVDIAGPDGLIVNGSVSIGGSTANGQSSIAAGGSFASGPFSIAMGAATASGQYSIAMGDSATARGDYSTAIGMFTTAAGSYSTAIGHSVTVGTESKGAVVIGSGGDGNLFNNIAESLMVGFRSDIPTLFVGPSNGPGTTGNVGIGTKSPGSYKLAVEGKIGAREVVVTLDNWSDFVFEKDYRLMPLHEVEQHIQQNQRLPDIPSEKEVLEKGVSLGEMQSKLLQKVEELTLYVIEQNKRIEKLEKENEELKGRVGSLVKSKD
ncbi:hypothetical protein HYR99_05130, partial [Candidatus Poribacteria bacterium]|nr:hypothetical protein [Candidatus Poribacteria bacterium]